MKRLLLNLLITLCLSGSVNVILGTSPLSSDFFYRDQPDNKNTGFLFAHAIGGDSKQIGWYCKGNSLNWHIIGNKYYSTNFTEAVNPKVDSARTSLAQEADMNSIALAHKHLNTELKTDKTVLIGVSRGASSIINYASYNPENIKALILESPFDCIESVVKNLVQRTGYDWLPGIDSIANIVKAMMNPAYNGKGIKPIDRISFIDKSIPVMFIHSKADKLVPLSSSVELAKKLKDSGHNDVYLLILSTGQHANYQFCPSAFKYMAVVHAFYKRYGIPYDPDFATDGEIYLDGCRL